MFAQWNLLAVQLPEQPELVEELVELVCQLCAPSCGRQLSSSSNNCLLWFANLSNRRTVLKASAQISTITEEIEA
jgi:hypothetical protein